jgi:hypothetical protein
MKFKKLMLATFLLLAVLTIGAVSAADDSLAADDMELSYAEDGVQTVESSQDDNPAEEAIASGDA